MLSIQNMIRAGVAGFLALGSTAPAEIDPLGPHATIAGITMGETSLAGAQRVLGPGEVRRGGDGEPASSWATCYVGDDGTTLALVAQAEAGGDAIVTGYQLLADGELADESAERGEATEGTARPRCARAGALSRSAVTPGGLRLGLTERAVLRLLGPPIEAGCDFLLFGSESDSQPRDDRSAGLAPDHQDDRVLHRVRRVRVEFAGGRVAAIRAEQITSPSPDRAPSRPGPRPRDEAANVARARPAPRARATRSPPPRPRRASLT